MAKGFWVRYPRSPQSTCSIALQRGPHVPVSGGSGWMTSRNGAFPSVCVSDLEEGCGDRQAAGVPAADGEELQGLCVADAAGRREAEPVGRQDLGGETGAHAARHGQTHPPAQHAGPGEPPDGEGPEEGNAAAWFKT